MKKIIPLVIFVSTVLFFFNPLFLSGKMPIPLDTIVGLYHPYRDLYVQDYPRGIPFKNFQITDPVRQQYPWRKLAIDSWKKFQVPLWNPYNFSGTPHLANLQSAAFYPLNFILFFIPFHLGWSILIMTQPLLAIIFMYIFLRNLRLSISASMLGAISFAFCGFFVSWMEWGNVVHTGLWLPLILLATDKILRKPSGNTRLWYLIIFFSFFFSFLAGHLQVFFYEFVVSVAYFIFRWYTGERIKIHIFSYIALILVLFSSLLFQLFPLFQLISLSARDIDQVSAAVPGWYLPWQNLTQFIAPDFFGNPSTLNYWGVWNYGEFIAYVGFIPLLFALHAIFFKRDKTVWFFTAFLLISLIFALPTLLAKIPFKFDIPLLSTSQPTRLLYIADISLSILAAFGFEYFFKTKRMIFIPLSAIGAFLLSFWFFVLSNQSFPHAFQVNTSDLAVTKNNLKLPTILFVVSLIIIAQFIFIEKKLKFAKNLFIATVLVITAIDLYRFTTKYITFADVEYLYPQTKIIKFLQSQKEPYRVMATDSRILPPNFSIMHKISTTDGYDPLFLRRYAELSAAAGRNQPNIDPPFGFNRIITLQNPHSDMLGILNVKYIISMDEIKSKRLKKVFTEGNSIVYQNLDFIPRAFFVKNTLQAFDKQDAINKLFKNYKNLNSVAIVEDMYLKSRDTWTIGKVVITKHEENEVVIHSENTGEGFVVLTDSYYPTWRAVIDGKETKIYLTDYNFRGIIVPKGKHIIRFYNNLF